MDKFITLYSISMNVSTYTQNNIKKITPSDIVSIAIINNYDTATFPIVRIRLYTDISVFQMITNDPDNIYVTANFDGGIYKINEDNDRPVMVYPAKSLSFSSKVYIENKNTPTSTMDQYENGLKKSSDLNTDVKVPIELYCYNASMIHNMRQKVPSIYTNISLTSVIQNILTTSDIRNFNLESLHNQAKYDQILIPNLNVSQALGFFDAKYGMYTKGAQIWGGLENKLFICNTDVNNGNTPIPIRVRSYKDNTDITGMSRINPNRYDMTTLAGNVSVISETDVEKVLNSQQIAAINVNTLNVDIGVLEKLYGLRTADAIYKASTRINDKISYFTKSLSKDGYIANKSSLNNINIPDILHKSLNPYITSSYIARMDEHITRVDVSGSGFNIGIMDVNSRYNLIFETPIRGLNINQQYRPTYVCHVLTNMDSELFVAQTTMNLVSN